MDERWQLFSRVLPADLAANKRRMGEVLRRLNQLRNAVMHPVKGGEFNREDLIFVLDLRNEFLSSKWRE
jgi:hypothetical protein